MFDNKIHISDGFQASVNIAFDLHDDEKVRSFIPTLSAIEILEEIILSTSPKATDRSRILIGAYGRGKSHIILVLLSILYKKERSLYDVLLDKIQIVNPPLYDYISNYIDGDTRLLPVVISGSSASLSQSFLNALQQTLEREGLHEVMPDTHFQAALNVINNWRNEYPDTFDRFIELLEEPFENFEIRLKQYEPSALEKFVALYPRLTSGSQFNPFIGFDVVEIYEQVNKKLQSCGYNGIFVVYDEFSKYLEASISNASISDIKLLQDFAEKCNRSAYKQMHLLLICHKDISNYIDENIPKEKVDGWRGVSGRFTHMELRNNFSQIYEIISTVIKKDEPFWTEFKANNQKSFLALTQKPICEELFDNFDESVLRETITGCYPLHPVSIFVLPRISEKVAQNERTLFTFLSAKEKYALPSFLEAEERGFPLLTADCIFDYFEPLLRKEPYTSEIHKLYKLTASALARVKSESLEARIIKYLCLVYAVAQFEKMQPTVDSVEAAFIETVDDPREIHTALDNLIQNECVVYLRRSNNFLKLKESSGIDLQEEIKRQVGIVSGRKSVQDILNEINIDGFLYPTRYNDEHDITRYFEFAFIDGASFLKRNDWNKALSETMADGILYAIVPDNAEQITEIRNALEAAKYPERIVFAMPKEYQNIYPLAFEYASVMSLREAAKDDLVVYEEYGIFLDDLEEVVGNYISSFVRPEAGQVFFYHSGERKKIQRKAQLSELLSIICDISFPYTPSINNESINKNVLPTVAINSRSKVLGGILKDPVERNLGLVGTGQDVSIMRSTLLKTGIYDECDSVPRLKLKTDDQNINRVLTTIDSFFEEAVTKSSVSFGELYSRLVSAEFGIGLKRGVIPIFLAVVLRKYAASLTIVCHEKEIKLTPDLLNSINESPDEYFVRIDEWNAEKEEYIVTLEHIFEEFVLPQEKSFNNLSYLLNAMNRWYLSLPKYTKEMAEVYKGSFPDRRAKAISKNKRKFMNALKLGAQNPREFLFESVFEIFGMKEFNLDVLDNIREVKREYDNAMKSLVSALSSDIKYIFGGSTAGESMISTVKNWYDSLSKNTLDNLFPNSENAVLDLISTTSNDEKLFITRMAKAISSLRIEDWNSHTIDSFIIEAQAFKEVVDEYNGRVLSGELSTINSYRIVFTDELGEEVSKSFEKVEVSSKASLLMNDIRTSLEEMGKSISEQEKRQVLMEILRDLC